MACSEVRHQYLIGIGISNDWRRAPRYVSSGQVLAEQSLRDEAAEGVADDDRRGPPPGTVL